MEVAIDRPMVLRSLAFLLEKSQTIADSDVIDIHDVASLRREATILSDRISDAQGIPKVVVESAKSLRLNVSDSIVERMQPSGWQSFKAKIPGLGIHFRIQQAEQEDEVRHELRRFNGAVDHLLFALNEL